MSLNTESPLKQKIRKQFKHSYLLIKHFYNLLISCKENMKLLSTPCFTTIQQNFMLKLTPLLHTKRAILEPILTKAIPTHLKAINPLFSSAKALYTNPCSIEREKENPFSNPKKAAILILA